MSNTSTTNLGFTQGGPSAFAGTVADLGKLVTINASGELALAGASDKVAGVITSIVPYATVGAQITYQCLTGSAVLLGGTVTAGDALTSAAGGLAVAAGGGDPVFGTATQGGASGSLVSCLLLPQAEAGPTGATGAAGAAGRVQVAFPLAFDQFPSTGLLVNNFRTGFNGTITRIYCVCVSASTGAAGDSLTINASIGGVATTGGVITLSGALANDPVGKFTAGTAITAANTFTSTSDIDIDVTVTDDITDGVATVYLELTPA